LMIYLAFGIGRNNRKQLLLTEVRHGFDIQWKASRQIWCVCASIALLKTVYKRQRHTDRRNKDLIRGIR
jgi:hypothetical protein